MNAVCTIVAKNYLSHARTLGDSLRKIHPDIPFHILLTDETDGMIDLSKEKYETIEFKDIGVPFYMEMAFKYTVIEFCTAVKPFFIEYLMKKYGYEKIIYFDPDIYVFNSIDCIYKELEENFMVLTPHFTSLEVDYSGAFAEGDILFSGINNLGFVALNNSENARQVLKWWCSRLKEACFVDKLDGYFVDQKWMDFLPAFFDKGVLINRNLGYNVAIWNIHERNIILKNGRYYIVSRFDKDKEYPLIFFHFSGLDPKDPNKMGRMDTKFKLDNTEEFRGLYEAYAEHLLSNGYDETSKLSYTYSKFANGIIIMRLHRRLYRILLENGYRFEDPFSVSKGSYFEILKKNKLIAYDEKMDYSSVKYNNMTHVEKKVGFLYNLMNFMKKVIGISNYSLLLQFLARYSKYEKQTFLLRDLYKEDIKLRVYR